MPELRTDPLTGHRVLLAPGRLHRPRARRREPATPGGPDPGCPFCPGREGMTPPETDALRPDGSAPDHPGWRLRCVPNKYPAAAPGPVQETGSGPFAALSGGGYHEVLVDSPAHTEGLADLPDAQSAQALRMIQRRARAFFQDPGVRALAVFKNHGLAAGASMAHSHLQLLALPAAPLLAERRRTNEARHFKETGEPLLAHLANEELKRGERIVEGGEGGALVLCPYASRFPYQVLILPWPAQVSFLDAPAETLDALGAALARQLRRLKGLLGDPPLNVFLHLDGRDGSDPRAHPWHIEAFPRLAGLAGLEAAGGMHILEVSPEEAAGRLRGVKKNSA